MRTIVLVLAAMMGAAVLRVEEKSSQLTLRPVVEVEENVYNFTPANNGAGPMWCSGSTCAVRIDERLRKEFFPGEKQSHTLQYAILRAGKVVSRRVLLKAEEGGAGIIPGRGRFHVTPDGRLFAFYYVHGKDAAGKAVSENRLRELGSEETCGQEVPVPLKHPFPEYFSATVRAGSPPSTTLDVLGHQVGAANTVSYARIRLW